jgi:predicted HicB family RNase H-like nuclease
MEKEATRKIVIKNFPEDLDRRAKEAAKREYISFKALVIRALENELKRLEQE